MGVHVSGDVLCALPASHLPSRQPYKPCCHPALWGKEEEGPQRGWHLAGSASPPRAVTAGLESVPLHPRWSQRFTARYTLLKMCVPVNSATE